MRPIARTALVAATAAVLAVTVAVPSGAVEGTAPDSGRPLVGSTAAAAAATTATVTLVTGDRVLVTTDADGDSSATALPAEDGTAPLLQTRRSGKDLYAYPDGAARALAAGRVDEELFNVTGLIRQGYDDQHSATLPLIATYDGSVDVARTVPATPRGAKRGLVLDAVDGVALKADKKKAADFWADIASPRSRAAGDLKKLWLDAKARSLLAESTKQVHADRAWAAGYAGKGTKVAVLDTGVDAEHPDLKGRIAASENFTDSADADDHQGHGTHTTSTVGGTGAASGGKEKGVAPEATLLNGKVLNDSGSGATSWIIAGMQWAVDEGADVVSMSLGNPSELDCSDPMAQATQELARSAKNTIFVIAAGNAGPHNNTVSSPGCVPEVLTVGAVDSDDATASFSSRSPVQRTHTLKPEIAAPGVAIEAAAAGGRGVYAYQSMSGTSMATPHVAGAAALVKQRHPDWSAARIKQALVSSADAGIPGDVRETGGGRLDVKAAIDQTVLGADAVQGGTFNWPQDRSDRTTVQVPYTNTTVKPVKLSLSVARVTGNDGSTVRSKVAALDARTVTVPAGGTVQVPLKLDPAAHLKAAQYGDVTGRILATGPGGTHLSTPFSLYVQPETVTLRVKVVDRRGEPATGASSVDVIGMDEASGERRVNDGAADQTYQVRPGAYFVSSFVATPAAEGTLVDSATFIGRPQLTVTKDTTVVLDARKAHRLSIRTDRDSEVRGASLGFARTFGTDHWLHSATVQGSRTVRAYYADVQGRATDGTFEFDSFWRAAAPQISAFGVTGGPDLHPVTGSTNSANLDGTGSAEIVDGGAGTAAELAASKDKLALVKLPEGGSASAVAQAAAKAGAKGVVLHREAAGRWYPATGFTGGPLPTLALETAEGAALAARIASGPTTLHWKATATSPYSYTLAFPETGQIRGDRTYRVADRDLATNTATYRAMGTAADYLDFPSVSRPNGLTAGFGDLFTIAAPSTRTELYSTDGTGFGHEVSSAFPFGEFMSDPARTYKKAERRTEEWYGGVLAPTTPLTATGEQALAAERQGNLIGVAPGFWGDGQHQGFQGSFGDIGSVQLKRDGEIVGQSGWPYGVFEVPAGDAAYELTLQTAKIGSRVWNRSTQTSTAWSFRSHLDESAYSQGVPLLFPHLTLPEDGLKTLAARDGQRIDLTATGHAGYTPGRITEAALSYSYDGGETWTEARTARHDGSWTATVDHAGATGEQVTLKVRLTDAKGASVTQTVTRAYDVR
ncbi:MULTISPECIES: S8 family serine peptidase [unclassified Streptomyces]|uniref:S8 family serine peptidase n=1 Tax=unclassified Streptomyces TaxID=2593676 RepID=UPI000DB9BEA3|nr:MULTISPECIES: S8 family serine peptidase [unclassified Streptomyces]MYT73883.1 S8 family serine peptidase [Streptomyces sp. SID8367]RAJ89296.1 subtilase family protein [Streptomyces sp. PsTaAH-137]